MQMMDSLSNIRLRSHAETKFLFQQNSTLSDVMTSSGVNSFQLSYRNLEEEEGRLTGKVVKC